MEFGVKTRETDLTGMALSISSISANSTLRRRSVGIAMTWRRN